MLIIGASQCGISIPLSELSFPMLMEVIEYNTKLMGENKVGSEKAKSLSEIAKGGKI